MITYDAVGDVLMIELVPGADNAKTTGEEVWPGVTLLFDRHDRILGIEIIAASKRVIPSALKESLP